MSHAINPIYCLPLRGPVFKTYPCKHTVNKYANELHVHSVFVHKECKKNDQNIERFILFFTKTEHMKIN